MVSGITQRKAKEIPSKGIWQGNSSKENLPSLSGVDFKDGLSSCDSLSECKQF